MFYLTENLGFRKELILQNFLLGKTGKLKQTDQKTNMKIYTEYHFLCGPRTKYKIGKQSSLLVFWKEQLLPTIMKGKNEELMGLGRT